MRPMQHAVATILAALASTAFALTLSAAEAEAQRPVFVPRADRIQLSGPRFGFTYMAGSLVDSLRAQEIDVSRLITQFGWQWERQFNVSDGGPTAVTEMVLLVGGLEQGAFLPSLSWIVGMRSPKGTEVGVGPNLSAAGYALVIAGGVTRRSGSLNLPLNLSIVPSSLGTRFSVLTGFTVR